MATYIFSGKGYKKFQREGVNYFSFRLESRALKPIVFKTQFQYNGSNYPTIVPYNTQIKQEKKDELLLFVKDWIEQCKSSFVKPPVLEECLENSFHEEGGIDTECFSLERDDYLYEFSWELREICIGSNKKVIFRWDLLSSETRPTAIELDDSTQPELHEPEKVFTIPNPASYPTQIPELTDIPLSDLSPFRLDSNHEKQREKYRKRIRDARIKAKLARYRAERLCAIYEERFGYWPSEDEDEAQTEVESDDSY